MDPCASTPYVLSVVNHCELVRAYYGGAFSVRRASLQVPAGAFFSVDGASSSSRKLPNSSPHQPRRRAGKKRKRADEALAQLAASGKFVPLDARVKRLLQAAHEELSQTGAASGLLPTWPSTARPAASAALPEPALLLESAGDALSLFTNHSDRVRVAAVMTEGAPERVLLPARASFAAADVRRLGELGLLPPRTFRWIVMDPPWENKSVARARSYATFRHEQLLRVDVAALAHPEACVLAVWVTNKPSYASFLRERALPRWGFTLHDTWFWLKVGADGALVTPLASTHRLPVEKLVVAYRGASEAARARLRRLLGDKPRVVASVPLRHSWKPPPESFFPAGALADGERKLELFARELRPHWTSVGLEVTKFQSLSLFDGPSGALEEAERAS